MVIPEYKLRRAQSAIQCIDLVEIALQAFRPVYNTVDMIAIVLTLAAHI